ncbi:MAG: class I tRNA ligase family protein, partial [Treponema sp.]|nr:class I tRNA ligase family protein [Treponema sp.]
SVFEGKKPANPLDAWIVSIAQKMVADVAAALDDYDLSMAIDPLVGFIDQLNNWYIRRSRRRFWKSENDADKAEAYESLYYALKTFSLAAAPFIPFVTETMWQNLRTDADAESVHLADFPAADARLRDEKLEFRMTTVQKAVSMGRSLRNQFNLKNRQPLASTQLVTRNKEERTVLESMTDTIREELNVKQVIFHEREDELVEYSAKANFKALGKRLGARMKTAAAKIAALKNQAIADIIGGGRVTIDVDGEQVDLDAESVIVERVEKEDLKVVNDGTLTVALDTKVTDELKREGYARDLVRGIQNLRKESGLEVTDRIRLFVSGDAGLRAAFETFREFIAGETLAVSAEWKDTIAGSASVEADDWTWSIAIEKV